MVSSEVESHRPWYHVRHDRWSDRFFYYGTGGMLDPKNYTIEPYVLSGGGNPRPWQWSKTRWAGFGRGFLLSQAAAFVGVGTVGAIFDPLNRTEGEGLDEHIGTVYDWHDAVQAQKSKWQIVALSAVLGALD